MRRSLLSITLLALALPGCGDEPTKESAIAPKTAKPSAAVTATSGTDKAGAVKPSISLRSASARSSAPSTVCTRYRAQLNVAKAKLASAPSATTLKAKVTNLEALVADACQ
jgi:hypothetical protein